MELKPYQQQVINDLDSFLEKVQETKDAARAFASYWFHHRRTPLQPFPGTAVEPYKNNVKNAPNVCVKVPTAGGKTFIACNAIKTIFNAFHYGRKKAVVWLVPSVTILEQTIGSLKDPSHPYRQKINSHFGNRVEVYDKNTLLQGGGFNAGTVEEQLSIFVLSFDSLRAKNKENRKVYQENGNLQSFGTLVGKDEEISLMKVIQALNPVVIVDESHNAGSEMSVEMLNDLHPCFVLDLTATPRKNSNIISFIDAIELKKENMVKLPVIVYNHNDKTEVIHSALQLQKKLELQAMAEKKAGGKYIRPVVLFQAQPRNDEDNTTFEKVKEKLIELKIPAEQIKIKTASINELKDINLISEDCPVRYIITVNALQEGWDCPFAYILASLADKSSPVDVEQILGRILRQPYVVKHNSAILNLSYVLTASAKFLDTLGNIVKGLNKAGFSGKDFKAPEKMMLEEKSLGPLEELVSATTDGPAELFEIDVKKIESRRNDTTIVQEIEQMALEQSNELETMINTLDATGAIPAPPEIQALVKTYPVKEVFREQALALRLPYFFIKKPIGDIFNEGEQMLSKEDLLEGFQLSKSDSNIAFTNISSGLYKVDLDETKKDYTPSFVKLDGAVKDKLIEYIIDPSRRDSRKKNFTQRIMGLVGRLDGIHESEIRKYIHKLLEDFTDEQYNDLANHEYSYSQKIKEKIKALSEEFAEKKFKDFLDTDKIFMQPGYSFALANTPGDTSKDITKSLYEKEGAMNGFEEKVINEIANLPNILFWTRNLERKQFKINGFIHHYPDFIVHTKSGKTILLETKGDDRDNSDSEKRIRLGKAWEAKAGTNFKYFMVFNQKEVDNAYKLDDFLKLIREI